MTIADANKKYVDIDGPAIRAAEEDYLFPTYKRYDVTLSHGSGVYLYDIAGKRYLDFLAGIAVNSLGYNHPRLNSVLRDQGQRLIHCSNLFYHPYQGLLAKRLAELAGLRKVFFTNSGTEANEAALKICRAYARTRGHENKTVVLAVKGAFHGRSYGSLSLTLQDKYQAPFRPLVPDIRAIEDPTVEALEQAFTSRTCALFIEAVQGENGIIPLPLDFLKAAREFCTRFDALLVLDEIQCGLGRTGKYFAYQHYGIEPDVVTVAKPLAAGYPLGAVIGGARVVDTLKPGEHGTTFGGGPLACRLALEFLDILEEEGLVDRAGQTGGYLLERIRQLTDRHPLIKEVRGMGLMIGIELGPAAPQAVRKLLEHGVIANAAHETVIRLLPPLVISRSHVDEFVAALDNVLKEIEKESAAGEAKRA
jgi:acetylornithine/N-succinyldiaminopimelate aminotransferase